MNVSQGQTVAIAVPLRGECDLLPSLLTALSNQTPGLWEQIRVHLLFDGIEDSDLPIINHLSVTEDADAPVSFTTHIVERAPTPNAGRARRQAVAYALADRRTPQPDILLTTDGDTVPAADWVNEAISALSRVDVVAGYIARDNTTPAPARDALEAYLEALHSLRRTVDPIAYDPPPSHPWVGGANLGLRTATYRQLGGFAAMPCEEDKALVDAARHAGVRVQQARSMRVVTSSRLNGRIEGGLSSALRFMAAEKTEPVVEHPHDAARQYARHAWARRLRDTGGASAKEWQRFAAEVNATPDAIHSLARQTPNGEAFAMKSVPVVPTQRSLPLSEAKAVLDTTDAKAFAFD